MFNRTMSKRRRLGCYIHALIDAVPKHGVMPVTVPTLFDRYTPTPPPLTWLAPSCSCPDPGLPCCRHAQPHLCPSRAALFSPLLTCVARSCPSLTLRFLCQSTQAGPVASPACRSSPTPHLRGTLLFLPLIKALLHVPVQSSAPCAPPHLPLSSPIPTCLARSCTCP